MRPAAGVMIAVDIRERAPTYGKWVGMVLSADNSRIPFLKQAREQEDAEWRA